MRTNDTNSTSNVTINTDTNSTNPPTKKRAKRRARPALRKIENRNAIILAPNLTEGKNWLVKHTRTAKKYNCKIVTPRTIQKLWGFGAMKLINPLNVTLSTSQAFNLMRTLDNRTKKIYSVSPVTI